MAVYHGSIIEYLATRKNISRRKAMDVYYKSRLSEQVQAGQYGIENLDYKYLAEDLIENSRAKLDKKHADMICANSIADGNTGFAVDTNKVTIITNDAVTELPLCSKEETADKILSHILTL